MNIHLHTNAKSNNLSLLLLLVPIIIFFLVTMVSFQIQHRQIANSGEISVLGTFQDLDTEFK